MDRLDLLLAGLALGVVGVAVGAHRAGPVERDDRGDVLEVVGLHGTQQLTHRPAVELEDAERVAAAEQGVRGRVVEGEVLEHEVDVAVGLDVVDGVVEHREVAQAQEVHLDQPERLAHRVVELGDDRAVLLALHDRHDVDQRLAAHDDAGGVHAPLADLAFEADGGVVDLADLGVALVQLAEVLAVAVALVAGVEELLERHALAHDVGGQRLGDALPHRERVVEHAVGVLDGRLGLEPSERGDHRDAVGAVLVADVADDLTAATLVEVDVEVGHGRALGVEEPLEDQAVLQRAEVGDAQRVGRDGAGAGTASRADPDAVVLGPVDEVGDHQVVAAVALVADDLQLHLGARPHLVGECRAVTPLDAPPDLLDEPGLLGVAGRDVGASHEAAVGLGELGLAPLGDEQGVVARLLEVVLVLPQRAHLLGGLDVVAVALELHALRVGDGGAEADAEQRVVGLAVVRVDVVRVVGGDDGEVEVLAELEQAVAHPGLDVEAVVHQLEEEVLLAEDVLELRGGRPGLLVVADAQPGLDLAGRAAGGADEPLGVLVQQLPVGARLVVVALEAGARRQPEQVVHALGRLREQRHVREGAATGHVVLSALVPLHPLLLAAVSVGREVGLHADDRLDSRFACLGVETEGAVDVAVVGHRDGRHAQLGGAFEQRTEERGAVEHRVFGVHVQVHEGRIARHDGGPPQEIGGKNFRLIERPDDMVETRGTHEPSDALRLAGTC